MVRLRTTTRPPNDLVSPSTSTAMPPLPALAASMADPCGWLQGDRHRLADAHVARLLRNRLDAEHQTRALLLTVDDRRREFGLRRDEVHPRHEGLGTPVTIDRD